MTRDAKNGTTDTTRRTTPALLLVLVLIVPLAAASPLDGPLFGTMRLEEPGGTCNGLVDTDCTEEFCNQAGCWIAHCAVWLTQCVVG